MMTVKHITLSGEESVYPTSWVNYVPASAIGTDGVDTIWIYTDDAPARPLTGGTVYVMNEHGKTVSRYDLSASVLPIQNMPLSPTNKPV